MTTARYIRKDRRSGVTGERKAGPSHLLTNGGLTLCGVRMKGVTIRTVDPESDRCLDCERHARLGTRGVWSP